MRSVLALGLLLALCASASAAKVHHSKPRHVTIRPSQGVNPYFMVPHWTQPSPYDTPNDPYKYGGGAA
jgi:hypothetical protein